MLITSVNPILIPKAFVFHWWIHGRFSGWYCRFCEQQQKQVKIRSTSRAQAAQHEPWIRNRSELYCANQTETDAFNETDALNMNVLITISVVQIKSHSKPAVLLLWPHKCFGLLMHFRSPTSHQLFSNAHISFNETEGRWVTWMLQTSRWLRDCPSPITHGHSWIRSDSKEQNGFVCSRVSAVVMAGVLPH